MDDQLDSSGNVGNRYYREALPVFEQIVYSCSNDVQFKEIMTVMRVQHIKNQRERGINSGYNSVSATHGMSLFGKNSTYQRSVKCHKFVYERFGSS